MYLCGQGFFVLPCIGYSRRFDRKTQFFTLAITIMKTFSIVATVLLLGFLLGSYTKKGATTPITYTGKLTPAMKVERGKYLVNAIGCDDCHSPKIMTERGPEIDPNRRLSGHPAEQPLAPIADKNVLKDYALFSMGLTSTTGPWGTSFAANLTPDDTGLGNWTEAQFIKAIREGKSKGMDGARPLLPPMPWVVYKNLSHEDLSSIFAYLQTIAPVKNAVPNPVPPSAL
jgi:hypothetical protein